MNKEQNKFYTSISKYYSEIFPYRPMQHKFVENGVGDLKGKAILDIGCATGELAFHLANSGAKVIGIDLNEDLLEQAKQGIGHFQSPGKTKRLQIASPNPKFQTGNMLELKTDFPKEQFDAVLCFGNTLVHLPTLDLIQQMLEGVKQVLKSGGQFLLQILNYDYIIDEYVAELPLIDTENIQFIRKYKFQKNNSLIRFQTELYIKEEDLSISNETTLMALRSFELIDLLKKIGFSDIRLFSNFKQDPLGGSHLPLILKCRKE